jgi:uncharacterized protein with PIN domain
MPFNYETECEKCNTRLKIVETPMNVPGGKEREEAPCPNCGHIVASHMTSGFIKAYFLKEINS